jgi:hypothetical protein
MSIIEHIRIRCEEQEDYTGTDDLNFYINDVFIGTTSIGSGETKDVGRSYLTEMFISDGDVLKIWEFDALDPSDLLLEHRISDSDISSGSITLNDQLSTAKYRFEIYFVEF